MTSKADLQLAVSADGVCNHCQRYDELVGSRVARGAEGKALLSSLVEQIKRKGEGNPYDCLIGVSGGTDSTYVAYLAKQMGLRPLAVHLDNGWNSELAVANVRQVLDVLDIDLETYVIDWPQFRDLQLAFLRASTPDGEIPSDHAIQATMWRTAGSIGTKTILSGMNFATESMSVPDWAYGHSDWRYIKDVHSEYGSMPIPSYPHYSLAYLGLVNARGIRTLSILNYVDYVKHEAQEVIKGELGWRDYGGKHHESIYTRFFQGVILPQKFGIDKRYGHYSDLINAGQLTRDEAMDLLRAPTYDLSLQAADKVYVLKKLGLDEEEYEAIMSRPVRSFRDFKNSYKTVQLMRRTVNFLRRKGWYGK
jgi:N-acetyl sugar amidotransferase